MNFKTFPLVTGSYADLLIITLSSVILKRYEDGKRCFTFNLLSVLLNISPFVKDLSKLCCAKLT